MSIPSCSTGEIRSASNVLEITVSRESARWAEMLILPTLFLWAVVFRSMAEDVLELAEVRASER
jgi:hypothetical protein